MASITASKRNAACRSRALQKLRRQFWLEYMVLMVAFRQEGAWIPRNVASAHLADAHPEEYRRLYGQEKGRA